MKGIVCEGAGGPEVLKASEVPDPKLKDGEVLIRVRATALNGADVMQRQGNYPPPPGASELLGLEACGQILQTSEGAHKFNIGDPVMTLLDGGGYAEMVAVPEGFVMPLPAHLSWEQGAAIPEAWLTAYLELVLLAELKRDEAVLIHAGASGVGAAAIQIARDIGATVFVTAGSSEKLAFCKAVLSNCHLFGLGLFQPDGNPEGRTLAAQDLGADHLINYKTEDFAQVIKKQTTTTSSLAGPVGTAKPPGVDVILDLVGAGYLPKNIESLSVDGRLLIVGLQSGIKAEIDLSQVLKKRLRIIGSTLRGRPREQKVDIVSKFSDAMLSKFESGHFKPQVDISFPLVQASKAHQYQADAKNKGKIILVP